MSPYLGMVGYGGGGTGLTLNSVSFGPGGPNELDWGGDRGVCFGGMLRAITRLWICLEYSGSYV